MQLAMPIETYRNNITFGAVKDIDTSDFVLWQFWGQNSELQKSSIAENCVENKLYSIAIVRFGDYTSQYIYRHRFTYRNLPS